ncbi:MAG: hypothetical protein KAS64_01210 [Spirochaetes bacterium]|nr:hypothetical protein [Spirochaetota bacterium]
MKSKYRVYIFFISILSLSCSDESYIDRQNIGVLSLNISVALNRTVTPPVDMTVANFDIEGSGPDGADFSISNQSETSLVINYLAPGAWTVTVYAKNSTGKLIAGGSTAVVIQSGLAATAAVVVQPLAGNGTLSVILSWQNILYDPNMTAALTPQGGSPQVLTFTMAGNSASYADSSLTAGYYVLAMVLKDGTDVIWGASEVVRILAGETTTFHTDIGSGSSSSSSTSSSVSSSSSTASSSSMISDVQVTDITSYTAIIRWKTIAPATSQVRYGFPDELALITPVYTNLVTNHVVLLDYLNAWYNYEYYAISVDASDNQYVSDTYGFSTPIDLTPPVISQVALNDLTSSTAKITWNTDERGDTEIKYWWFIGSSKYTRTTYNNQMVYSHGMIINGMPANHQIYLEIYSANLTGIQGSSGTFTFTTLP